MICKLNRREATLLTQLHGEKALDKKRVKDRRQLPNRSIIALLPEEFRRLLKGSIVRFPDASEHHKKLAEFAISAFEPTARKLAQPATYRVESEIFERIVLDVWSLLSSHERTDTGMYELGHDICGLPFVRSADDLVAFSIYGA